MLRKSIIESDCDMTGITLHVQQLSSGLIGSSRKVTSGACVIGLALENARGAFQSRHVSLLDVVLRIYCPLPTRLM